tara:strand:+ start:580 stop:771 length:192 start_codon:yes stop_codon:yes gene_type:complete
MERRNYLMNNLDLAIYLAMKEKGLIPDKPVAIANNLEDTKFVKTGNVPSKRFRRNKMKKLNKK